MGKKVGAKPRWANVRQFNRDVEGFFNWCLVEDYVPDIEALAEYLDTTRKTIHDYEKKPEFSYTIKRLKTKIFNKKKQAAFKGKIPAAVFIFDAKNNHGYRDKQEVKHEGKIKTAINIMPASTLKK